MSVGSAPCRSLAMSVHSSIRDWIGWRVRVAVPLKACRSRGSAASRRTLASAIHLPISPVVGRLVDPKALHAPLAHAAEQRACERVTRWRRCGLCWQGPCHRAARMSWACWKTSALTTCGWGDLLGPDPPPRVVPPHLRLVAERDVIPIDQHFVLALAVPHMAACVPRAGQDTPPSSAAGATRARTSQGCRRTVSLFES